MKHLTREELEAGFAHVRQSPEDGGPVQMIVRRPGTDQREMMDEGFLDPERGLVGDNWHTNKYGLKSDELLDTQITVMNARAAALVAQSRERWALAGDQLYIDLDLSDENLPPGTRLRLGAAVIEVTAEPHTGCRKFSARYGPDATRFFNSRRGRQCNLRGINARVVEAGTVRVGDTASKIQG